MSPKDWVKFICLGLVWGSSFLWIKIAVAEVGPLTLVSYRVWFALLGLVVALALVRPRRPQQKDLPALFLLAVFNVAVPFALISWSEQTITSAMASILNSTVPLFTILIAPLFLSEERLTPRRLLGLLMGFAGVVVLVSTPSGGGLGRLGPGTLAMLLAALCYAGSAVFARRRTHHLSAEVQSIGQMLGASLIISPAAALLEAPFHLPRLPITWVALAWLGLLGSCVGTLLFYSLLKTAGPTRTTLTTYVFPLVGVALGWAVLGEQPGWRLLAGGMLIISGIVIVNSRLRFPAWRTGPAED